MINILPSDKITARRRLARSHSDRVTRGKRSEDVMHAQSAKTHTLPVAKTTDNIPTPSSDIAAAAQSDHRPSGFSLRRISRSLRLGKGKGRDTEDGSPQPAPHSTGGNVERRKSGFMRFLSSLRGNWGVREPAMEPVKEASVVTLDSPTKKTDYFKSKKVCRMHASFSSSHTDARRASICGSRDTGRTRSALAPWPSAT